MMSLYSTPILWQFCWSCKVSKCNWTCWINVHQKLLINEMQYLHCLPLLKYTPLKILRHRSIVSWWIGKRARNIFAIPESELNWSFPLWILLSHFQSCELQRCHKRAGCYISPGHHIADTELQILVCFSSNFVAIFMLCSSVVQNFVDDVLCTNFWDKVKTSIVLIAYSFPVFVSNRWLKPV